MLGKALYKAMLAYEAESAVEEESDTPLSRGDTDYNRAVVPTAGYATLPDAHLVPASWNTRIVTYMWEEYASRTPTPHMLWHPNT